MSLEIKRKIGNEAVLSLRKTAYLCSRNAPRVLTKIIEYWVNELQPDEDCVLCGNHSPAEKIAFSMLLEHKIPTVLVLAEAMKSVWDDEIQAALNEKRLLIITHCDDNVHRITARSAFDRNRLLLSLADDIIVGYCEKGGNLERLMKDYDDVAYILTDNGERSSYYIDPVELYGKESTEPVGIEIDPWERSVKTVNGLITLGFAGSGADKFARIVQTEGDETVSKRVGRISLGCAEFVKFCDVLKRVFHDMESGKDVDKGIFVASLSGEVTFGVRREDNSKTLIINQRKDLGSMGLRSETLFVDEKYILLFYDVLIEAQQHFFEND